MNNLLTKNGYYLILGCSHFPYHNADMFDLFLEVQKDVNPVLTILNGDIIDLASLSSHQKGQKVFTGLQEEVELTNRELDKIRGNVEYLYGNHEMRFHSLHKDIDIAKLGPPDLTKALKLKERRWKVQTDWKNGFVNVGEFRVFHGVYTGANPAKKHVTSLNESCIFNHTHQIDHYYENKFSGHNIGWGGYAKHRAFDYVSDSVKSTWRNGFAVIYVDGKDSFVHQIEMKNGKFHFNGKLYSAR